MVIHIQKKIKQSKANNEEKKNHELYELNLICFNSGFILLILVLFLGAIHKVRALNSYNVNYKTRIFIDFQDVFHLNQEQFFLAIFVGVCR